jgi:hypothetical protein
MIFKKQLLKDEKKEQLQKRIYHLINSLRIKHHLTQESFSEQAGFTLNQIKSWEKESSISPFVTAYENLFSLASIVNMSIHDLIVYMEDEDGYENLHRSLHDWEKTLLEKFKKIDLTLRRNFIHAILSHMPQDIFRENLILFIKILNLSKQDRGIINDLVERLNNGNKNNA